MVGSTVGGEGRAERIDFLNGFAVFVGPGRAHMWALIMWAHIGPHGLLWALQNIFCKKEVVTLVTYIS